MSNSAFFDACAQREAARGDPARVAAIDATLRAQYEITASVLMFGINSFDQVRAAIFSWHTTHLDGTIARVTDADVKVTRERGVAASCCLEQRKYSLIRPMLIELGGVVMEPTLAIFHSPRA